MKYLAFVLCLAASVSSYATDKFDHIADLLLVKKCSVEVIRPEGIIFEAGKKKQRIGEVTLFVKTIDNENNRRLPNGRILKHRLADPGLGGKLYFNDPSISSMCIEDGRGDCIPFSQISGMNFEAASDRSLRIKCNIRPTVDF